MPTDREIKQDPKGQKAMEDFVKLRSAGDCVNTPTEGNDKIIQAGEDLFYVVARKTLKIMGALSKYVSYLGCTMTIIRTGDDLTIINSARLTDEDMDALDALGKVKNIVRIGSCHGSSDPYYIQRYKEAEYWVLEEMVLHEGLEKQPKFLKEGSVPIKGMRVFFVPRTKLPEAVLYLPANGGTLVTCDVVQNNVQVFPSQTSYLMAIFMSFGGFKGKARIGPGFVQFGYTCWGIDAKPILSNFFEEILKLPIEILLPGHGVPLTTDVALSIQTSLSQLK